MMDGHSPLSLLLLADSRLPTGGHAHSAGMESAVGGGWVTSPDDVEHWLAARVPTAGLVAAAATAAACALASDSARTARSRASSDETRRSRPGERSDARTRTEDSVALSARACRSRGTGWERWDAAISARTPVAALREASRAQGRALLRTARATWPSPLLDDLGSRPHQAVVLGVTTAIAGGAPADAAGLAVHHLVGQACTAAVRLRGMDPLALSGVHARALDAAAPVVAEATTAGIAAAEADDPALLPAASTPLPEILAVVHARSEGALFAS